MKVLIFSQYFWPETFRINDVAKSLLEKGVDVEVLTGKPNYPRGKIYNEYRAWGFNQDSYRGISINRVPLIPRGRSGWQLALNYLSFVISGLIFAPFLLRKKKFDVIFTYAPSPILQAIPAIFLGKIKGCPVVLSVQDLWPESLLATGYVRNRIVVVIVERIVRFIYKHVDLLLVQSQAFERPVKAYASGTPVVYYPNSVDSTFAVPATIELPSINGMDDSFSVLFAGNIGSAQAVGVIVDAATLLRSYGNINFIVLGEGSSREWMLKEVQQRALTNLHLPGMFPLEVMPGLMQMASVLLVTLADQPIFAATVPNKIQAYLAAGRPIIACLNGEGARLVVEAEAGLATPAEDPKSLADTVLLLHGLSAGEQRKMGENGRNYYQKHFNHDRLIDQLIVHLQSKFKNRKNML
ncbi:glycosyltransferase family 4 protein [Burkholderiales bacterium]|jgi:glycosyltransferase involved in cell wall biosynthesis|nr:glycosyltransferase family 4 protein [Burkholderiales bacterium]